MKKFMQITVTVAIFVFLVIGVTFGIWYFLKPNTPNTTEMKNNIRQELIKELDTNKKIVVFEYEKITDTIEEEQETLREFIDYGLDRNYIINSIEIVEGYLVNDRTILIFENGY